jgi:hypothetical protein
MVRSPGVDPIRPIQDGDRMPSRDDGAKFRKSQLNQGVQSAGLKLLLSDARFQELTLQAKRKVVALIGNRPGFGTFSFDLIMKSPGIGPVGEHNVDELWPQLRLVEMKATKKPIKSAALNGLFFGVTANEIRLAELLGEKFLFAFVVLNSKNDFGRPFARMLTLAELRDRTRPWRTQYQVNFRTDLPSEGLVEDKETIFVLNPPAEGEA